MMKKSYSPSTSIVAIVQARMGSTRLPGKVLMEIMGKPMLWHIVNRLSWSKLIDKIVVASSRNKQDDLIEEFCRRNNIEFYRGSEEDLVDRFYQTAKLFEAEIVVRVTADCPLVDPKIVDEVVGFFIEHKESYDYVSNSRPKATYPHGLDVEVFSFSLLNRLWNELNEPFLREWFTTVIFQNPQRYRIFCLENEKDLSHLRLTVDYREDLELIRYIYRNLYSEERCFSLQDILRLQVSNPAMFEINKAYKRDEQYLKELEKRRFE